MSLRFSNNDDGGGLNNKRDEENLAIFTLRIHVY